MRLFKASRAPFLIGALSLLLTWPAGTRAQEADEALTRDLSISQRPIWQFQQQATAATAARPPAQRLDVEAWVDRRDGVYKLGQPVTISVRPRADAHIAVLNYGTSGRMTVLYPNSQQRDARIRAGQVLQIPPSSGGLRVTANGPAGVEVIQVLASSRPLSLRELSVIGAAGAPPFVTMGRSAEDVARDLQLEIAPSPTANGPLASRLIMFRVVPETASSLVPAPIQMPLPGPGLAMPTGLASPAATMPAPGLLIRTDRNSYRVGEPVQVTVMASRPCALTLLTAGPSGSVNQLYPNTAQPAAMLMPGQALVVPPTGGGLDLRARGPAGIETIVGVCGGGTPAVFQQVMTSREGTMAARDLALAASQPEAVSEQAAAAYFVQ